MKEVKIERKIGEIFEVGGEWYQCVEHKGCHSCAFTRSHGRKCGFNGYPHCAYRSDGKSVIFKKLEKVGEPYLAHDHSRNKDVIVQDYKLHSQGACYNGHEEMLSFGLCGRNGIVTIKSKEPIKSSNCENSVEIEIKQNKEDMEERKLNLKPFDLEAAKVGKPVCTRDGRKARIICFDRIDKFSHIVALITNLDGREIIWGYEDSGACSNDNKNNDLMMLPEKKEGWINIYKGGKMDADFIYPTKADAVENMYPPMKDNYIDTIKVEWEE